MLFNLKKYLLDLAHYAPTWKWATKNQTQTKQHLIQDKMSWSTKRWADQPTNKAADQNEQPKRGGRYSQPNTKGTAPKEILRNRSIKFNNNLRNNPRLNRHAEIWLYWKITTSFYFCTISFTIYTVFGSPQLRVSAPIPNPKGKYE